MKKKFLVMYFLGVLISSMLGFTSLTLAYFGVNYFFPKVSVPYWTVPALSGLQIFSFSAILLTENPKKAFQIVWLLPNLIFSMGRLGR